MRFGTLDGRFVALRDGLAVDTGLDPLSALARLDSLGASLPPFPYEESSLGAPVPHPRQVFAVALNYRPHAAEAGYRPPADPLIFTKFPSCITGPFAEVTLPPGRPDWEIEVVAVIGAGGFAIPRSQAWDAVAGLTVGQDLSERELQTRGTPPQFSLAKSFPGFGPTGPVLVTPDEFPDRDDIAFTCHLGDELVQHGRTSEMIFPIPELVARISAVCPLLPGDLIFTGTPAGVGNRRTPPRYLRPGEVLTSRVEGIGEIRQTFR
ncbi:fumarylacetoacetate hydrolase [Actinoplanes sp. OR16]|uniref:fumarylacetoacetate hydrolase family protein n=1 Tax=Actinoplanes sp. OR16 TaxID=946334 RepID=UPI000F6B5197|nr:fumarylacetoacetate hydrolase family protein [Actinoplanes sp. OR16]BBH68553.1 fumarylacetoacetate hydrolase [Actinoplanes sp. OR16]